MYNYLKLNGRISTCDLIQFNSRHIVNSISDVWMFWHSIESSCISNWFLICFLFVTWLKRVWLKFLGLNPTVTKTNFHCTWLLKSWLSSWFIRLPGSPITNMSTPRDVDLPIYSIYRTRYNAPLADSLLRSINK